MVTLYQSQADLRVFLCAACLVAVFAAAGVLAIVAPMVVVLALTGAIALLRGEYLFRDVLFLLVAGSMLLTYGFANVGISSGAVPLPITELLLLPLIAWVLLSAGPLRSVGAPLLLLGLLAGLATVRLVADFPEHGKLAVRDFTLPLEALSFVVGYWALQQYGVRWAVRLFGIVFLMVVAYGLLMPWRDEVAALGPTVGLQQPVRLLGQFDALAPALAAAFFFFLIAFKHPWSIILAAVCLGELALLQMRGLYLAVPLALVLALIAAGKLPQRLHMRVVATLAVAGILLVLLAPMVPSGRLGPVNTSFAMSQIGTLFGKEGPGDGSYEVRKEWTEKTWARLSESNVSLFFGLGLGVDLASGFSTNNLVDVRKPHNDHLEVLARLGLTGFALWAAFLASVLLPVWRTVRSGDLGDEERHLLLWVVPASTIYLFIAATQPLLAYPQGTIPLFLMLGMGLAVVRLRKARPVAVSPLAAGGRDMHANFGRLPAGGF